MKEISILKLPMMKNSTLFYFVNNYQDDERDFEILDLSGKETEVNSVYDGKSIFKPSAQSVSAILNFAKSYEVLQSKAAGCIEMNKN